MGPHVAIEAVENWREKGAANEDRDARIVKQQQRVRDFLKKKMRLETCWEHGAANDDRDAPFNLLSSFFFGFYKKKIKKKF